MFSYNMSMGPSSFCLGSGLGSASLLARGVGTSIPRRGSVPCSCYITKHESASSERIQKIIFWSGRSSVKSINSTTEERISRQCLKTGGYELVLR